jgi:hypothetical protein
MSAAHCTALPSMTPGMATGTVLPCTDSGRGCWDGVLVGLYGTGAHWGTSSGGAGQHSQHSQQRDTALGLATLAQRRSTSVSLPTGAGRTGVRTGQVDHCQGYPKGPQHSSAL